MTNNTLQEFVDKYTANRDFPVGSKVRFRVWNLGTGPQEAEGYVLNHYVDTDNFLKYTSMKLTPPPNGETEEYVTFMQALAANLLGESQYILAYQDDKAETRIERVSAEEILWRVE